MECPNVNARHYLKETKRRSCPQGIGINYKPWITIQNVSSLGRVTCLKGIKIPRQFEYLSDLERNYFYLLEYSNLIADI